MNQFEFLPFLLPPPYSLNYTLYWSKTHSDDIQVLQNLKNGFDPNFTSPGSCLSSWDSSVNQCDHIFTGRYTCGFRYDIIVYGSNRVTEISLDQAGYAGSIANVSFNMPYLEILDLSYNSLSGSVPESFSRLTSIRRLSLSKNNFTGSIPNSLGSLVRLQELYLDNNRLTGSIPPSFNRLLSLKRLELQQNSLTGDLPDLSQVRNLYFLDLSHNQISGNFLEILPHSVIEVSFRNNSLKGVSAFKRNVAELRFLQVLDLRYNELTWVVSSFLFDHPSLQQLTLSRNNFAFLGAPSRLVAIDLSYNELHGLWPAVMAWMPDMSALSLAHNKFTVISAAVTGRELLVWADSGPVYGPEAWDC